MQYPKHRGIRNKILRVSAIVHGFETRHLPRAVSKVPLWLQLQEIEDRDAIGCGGLHIKSAVRSHSASGTGYLRRVSVSVSVSLAALGGSHVVDDPHRRRANSLQAFNRELHFVSGGLAVPND